jgi:hypothetical protein
MTRLVQFRRVGLMRTYSIFARSKGAAECQLDTDSCNANSKPTCRSVETPALEKRSKPMTSSVELANASGWMRIRQN